MALVATGYQSSFIHLAQLVMALATCAKKGKSVSSGYPEVGRFDPPSGQYVVLGKDTERQVAPVI